MWAMLGVGCFGVHTLSSASLAVLRFWLPGPFRLRVSTCLWIRDESGALVGDVCSSSL
jgi:hypothetical protein